MATTQPQSEAETDERPARTIRVRKMDFHMLRRPQDVDA